MMTMNWAAAMRVSASQRRDETSRAGVCSAVVRICAILSYYP